MLNVVGSSQLQSGGPPELLAQDLKAKDRVVSGSGWLVEIDGQE